MDWWDDELSDELSDEEEGSSTQYSETGHSYDLDRDVPPDDYLEELLGEDGSNPDDTDLFIEPEDDDKIKFENGE